MTTINYKTVNERCDAAAERIVPALPTKPKSGGWDWDVWDDYYEGLKERDFSAEIDAELSTWDWVNDPTLSKSILKIITRYSLNWIKEKYKIVEDFDNKIVFLYLREVLAERVRRTQSYRLDQTRRTVFLPKPSKWYN